MTTDPLRSLISECRKVLERANAASIRGDVRKKRDLLLESSLMAESIFVTMGGEPASALFKYTHDFITRPCDPAEALRLLAEVERTMI